MLKTSIWIICLVFLTAIVVFSAGRIEYLNTTGGHVLPRHYADEKMGKWEIAEHNVVMDRLDDQIFRRRQLGSFVINDDDTVRAAPVFGAPYSTSEQRSINTVTYQHDVLTKLHWNIRTFGLAQYFLAPATLLFAIVYGLSQKKVAAKVIALACGSLCCVGIFLMIVRGYWQSLG